MIKRGLKGQVSVFIIIALLIIGFVIVFSIFRISTGIGKTPDNLKAEVNLIDSYLKDCNNQRAVDAVRIVGLQGGYLTPEEYLSTNLSNVAYGYYLGKNTLASKSKIESEIKNYIELTSAYCIVSDDFPEMDIKVEEPSVSVKINKNSVSISSRIKISVSKDKTSFLIDRNYETEIPVKLGDMLETANIIVEQEIKEPDYIPVSYLAGLDYHVGVMNIDENNIVYIITDSSEESRIDDIGYSFLFANKFKEER